MKYYNYPNGTKTAEALDSENTSVVKGPDGKYLVPNELPAIKAEDAGKVVKVNAAGTGLEYGEAGGGVIIGKATGTGESSGSTIVIETTLTENYLNSIGAFDEDGAFAKAVFVSIPDGKLTSPYYTYENGTILAPLFGTGEFRHRIYETGINNSGTICITLVESKN